MGRVLAVANQKGGVAKTTTVASLGVALSELGRRVLLVDLDPQACLTFSLGLDPDTIEISVHDVLLGRVGANVAITASRNTRSAVGNFGGKPAIGAPAAQGVVITASAAQGNQQRIDLIAPPQDCCCAR